MLNLFTKAALAASSVLILTSVHHLYGAWRFDTPWRAHVAQIAAIAAIVLGAFLLASWATGAVQSGAGASPRSWS